MSQYGNQIRLIGYVSQDELDALRALAKREDRSVASLVRLAIRQLLEREEK